MLFVLVVFAEIVCVCDFICIFKKFTFRMLFKDDSDCCVIVAQ